MTTDTIGRRQAVDVNRGHCEVHQPTMVQHHTLGLSRRTGGINHIGQILWRRLRPLAVGYWLFSRRECGVARAISYWLFTINCQLSIVNCQFVYHQPGFAVGKHKIDAVFRILRVNGQIGCTCLVDAYHCYDKFLCAIHVEGNKLIRMHLLVL